MARYLTPEYQAFFNHAVAWVCEPVHAALLGFGGLVIVTLLILGAVQDRKRRREANEPRGKTLDLRGAKVTDASFVAIAPATDVAALRAAVTEGMGYASEEPGEQIRPFPASPATTLPNVLEVDEAADAAFDELRNEGNPVLKAAAIVAEEEDRLAGTQNATLPLESPFNAARFADKVTEVGGRVTTPLLNPSQSSISPRDNEDEDDRVGISSNKAEPAASEPKPEAIDDCHDSWDSDDRGSFGVESKPADAGEQTTSTTGEVVQFVKPDQTGIPKLNHPNDTVTVLGDNTPSTVDPLGINGRITDDGRPIYTDTH